MSESTAPLLPNGFLDRLTQIVPGSHRAEVWESFRTPKRTAFRVTDLRSDSPCVAEQLSRLGVEWRPFPWHAMAGSVAPEDRRRLLEFRDRSGHAIYIQNPASMLVALSVEARPGEQVLDLAAAPGGKAILLAEQMQNRGYLALVERVRSRFFKLQRQIRDHGVTIAKLFLADGRTIGRKTPDRFDRVLIDAPCTGEARFRDADPPSWGHWSARKLREQSRKQKGLLQSGLQSLRPGGTLVYATCSFAPEENEAVVDHVLRRNAGSVEVVPLRLPITRIMPGLTIWQEQRFDDSLIHAVRILPDDRFDGFFLVKLRKV